LQSHERDHFASVSTGLRGYQTRHNLATLYQSQGRLAESEAQWHRALAERQDFLPAALGLAELYCGQARWPEMERILGQLEVQNQGAVEVPVFRARRHLVQGEFWHARQLLQGVIARFPQALWPRVLLTHAWLQEGRDWPAAEQALRDVLALDPSHAEARRNLDTLLRQQGHSVA
jgi:tetratricopeptide (TPR) repeat protein